MDKEVSEFMKEIELIVGKRNKKGIFKKTKWFPNALLISSEQYNEYATLKNEKAGKIVMHLVHIEKKTNCHIGGS